MTHTYPCHLRRADVDYVQHVNNVRILELVDEARRDFFASIDPALDDALLTTGDDILFVKPIEVGPYPVVIDVWVSELEGSDLTLGVEIRSEGATPHVHARLTSTLGTRDGTGLDTWSAALGAHRREAEDA